MPCIRINARVALEARGICDTDRMSEISPELDTKQAPAIRDKVQDPEAPERGLRYHVGVSKKKARPEGLAVNQ